MFFLRIRGLLIVCAAIFTFSCGSKLPVVEENNSLPDRKVYVVLRSEGTPETLQNLKNILSSDFIENNISTNFSLYRAKQRWNQNQIFQTAYQEQYDYIVLIDQVAKFIIDATTQIGGKYQLRSYHIKSSDPDWLDLGQATCNISVTPSIQKFSREIIRGIVGNQAKFKGHDFEYDDTVATKSDKTITTEETKDLTSEVERLKQELEAEKIKTRLAEAEKKRAENQLKLEVEAQKQKARMAQLTLKEATKKKKQRQKDIAEAYIAKREEIKKREAEEALRNPPIVESGPKELTREERIIERKNTKKRLAKAREAAKREAAAALLKRQKERQRLTEAKREEQKRIREEKVAQNKKREGQLIKQKEAEILTLKEAENKRKEEQRKADELALQKEAAERFAEQKRKEELRRIEKEKTEALAAQQRKAKRIAEQKKLEEQRKADELALQKKEAERLAEQKRKEELRIEKEKADELTAQQRKVQKLAQNRAKEKQQNKNKRKKQPKRDKDILPISSTNQINALIIIRGKESDEKIFKNLRDHVEFNFMFAKAKAQTVIFNSQQSVSLNDVTSILSEAQNYAVVIDQGEYLGDGKSNYQIKVLNKQSNQGWKNIVEDAYNLSTRDALKKLSQQITNSVKN